MSVHLISYTPTPEQTIVLGYLNCSTPSNKLTAKLLEKPLGDRIAKMFKDGHFSPMEHASATVRITDVSRSLLAQITRHRIASFSVRSMRAVPIASDEIVIPPSIAEHPEANEYYQTIASNVHAAYAYMMKLGIPMEDARYILPIGTKTEIVMTMNFRSWLHFLRMRTGLVGKPQWEIAGVAKRIRAHLLCIAPNVFSSKYQEFWE